jgi:histidyl-tRNA synthetase
VSHVLILGGRELAEGKLQVKELASGNQKELQLSRLENLLETEKIITAEKSPEQAIIDRLLGD